MKGMNKELQSVVKGLKTLLKKTERIEREIRKIPHERSRRERRSVRKPIRPGRSGQETAILAVYGVIKRRKRGATTTQIRDKTGFDNKKIWNAINRLKTQKKIKNARRGIYLAV